MALSADEKKELDRLTKAQKEEETALAEAEAQKAEAEKEKQKALAVGDKKGAKEAQETITASESSVHALLEEMKRTQEMIVTLAEFKGGAEGKAAVQAVQRRRFMRNS